MMCPPGIRHPPSVVYAQVDLYPHHNVGQEGSRHARQYPQVEQLVGKAKSRTFVVKMPAQNPMFMVMC